MKTHQQTLTGELVKRQTGEPFAPVTEMLWLPIKYFVGTANIQQWLFLFSFLTYGVGDSISATYMMEKTGVMREINPIVRLLYASSGAQGVIAIKIWFAFVILFLVWIISRRTNMYWTINGFLSALCIGGTMAIGANMMVVYGMEPPSAGSIIMTYLILTVFFIMIGDLMDKLKGSDSSSLQS